MAKISQKTFSWKELEQKKDFDRLKLVIETIPDEELMVVLEREKNTAETIIQ
jgi:hypothetical protein